MTTVLSLDYLLELGFLEEDFHPLYGAGSAHPDLSEEELGSSEAAVAGILDLLPEDERDVFAIWMHLGGDMGHGVGRQAAGLLGMPETTFRRKLQSAIQHAQQAAAKYYSDKAAPEHYTQPLAGVEVEPQDITGLVLSTYRELNSVRKTADHLGINREKVRRIVNKAA